MTIEKQMVVETGNDELSTAKRWCLAILFTSLINLTSLSGIIFKPILNKPLFAWLLIWMIGLGVGSMCSVSILQLIPEALDINTSVYTTHILVIIASIYAFYLADKLTCVIRHKEHRSQITTCQEDNGGENEEYDNQIKKHGCSVGKFRIRDVSTTVWLIVICDSLHNFVDGLTISAALLSGYKEGVAIFLAILFEEIPCEIGDFAVFMKSGLTLSAALAFNFASSVTNYIGVIVGFLISRSINIRCWIYGIAAGMFLYISLGVLLFELNDQERRVVSKGYSKGNRTRRLIAVLFVQNCGILLGFSIQVLVTIYA